jgi:hypothetical protein
MAAAVAIYEAMGFERAPAFDFTPSDYLRRWRAPMTPEPTPRWERNPEQGYRPASADKHSLIR